VTKEKTPPSARTDGGADLVTHRIVDCGTEVTVKVIFQYRCGVN